MYYLYHTKNHTTVPLGEESFNKFYAEDGWYILNKMVAYNDLNLNNFIVKDSSGADYSIEDFLSEIEKYELQA